MKALLMSKGIEVWGHDLIRLLRKAEEIGFRPSAEVVDASRGAGQALRYFQVPERVR